MSETTAHAESLLVARSQSNSVGWHIYDYGIDAYLMTLAESILHSLPELMAKGLTGFSWIAPPLVGAVMISELAGKIGNHMFGRKAEAEHSSHTDGILTFMGKEAIPAITFAALAIGTGALSAGATPLATAAYIAGKHMFMTGGVANAIRNRLEAPVRQLDNTLRWFRGEARTP